jgi:hypothetical protein
LLAGTDALVLTEAIIVHGGRSAVISVQLPGV